MITKIDSSVGWVKPTASVNQRAKIIQTWWVSPTLRVGQSPCPRYESRKGRRMSKRVLIVDDSSIMRKMVRKNLESGGHTILGEAKNGIEAIELYRSLKPDVVTMDVTMRDMDGFTAAEKILASDPNARIIFLSNLDKDKYSENAVRLGSLGYIKKHNAKEMLALIESIRIK